MRKESLVIALFAIVFCMGFVSCGNDDEEDGKNAENAGTQNVFPEGMKKVASIYNGYETTTFAYEGNKLVSIKEGATTTINIVYSGNTVVATSVYKSGSTEEKFIYTMNIEANGFVGSGKIEYIDSDGSEDNGSFSCEYNDGYLTKFRLSSDKNSEEYRLTWKDGNITKVVGNATEEGYTPSSSAVTITYGSDLNTAKLAFFDDLGADIDELEYIYYAGLLGKSTSNLPAKAVESDDDDKKGETSVFNYKFGSDNYPSKMTVQYYIEGIDGGSSRTDTKEFIYR